MKAHTVAKTINIQLKTDIIGKLSNSQALVDIVLKCTCMEYIENGAVFQFTHRNGSSSQISLDSEVDKCRAQ